MNTNYINPFSKEAKEIIKEGIDLDTLFNINPDILHIIRNTKTQNISNDNYIAKTYAELSIKRIEWYVRNKYDKTFQHNDYAYFLNHLISKQDTIAFYIICQALATKFNPKSRECKLFIESQGRLISDRLKSLNTQERTETINTILNQLIEEDKLKWTQLNQLINNKRLDLTKIILNNGNIILEKNEFIEEFEDKFTNRRSDSMYNILIGEKLKTMIITNIIQQKLEDYLIKIHEMSTKIESHPAIIKISNELEENIKTNIAKSTFHTEENIGNIKADKLQSKAFPPCIQNTINGVKSGNRNDAIVLLLTSFISYARLYPSIFRNETTMKVSDLDSDLKITENEILPIIFEAANNCSPPLFDDDPQEKLNIISKLGFGVQSKPNLKNEGESKWYTPMSCDKIKIHLSTLCKPNKTCKNISNPLSYYNSACWKLKHKKQP